MFWRRLYISLWGNHSITTLTVNFWQWYFFFRNVANHFFFFFPSWIGTIHVCWFAKLHLFGAVLEYEPLCFQCRWVGDSFCTDTIKVVFIICGWRHCLYPMLYSLLFNNPCRVFFLFLVTWTRQYAQMWQWSLVVPLRIFIQLFF